MRYVDVGNAMDYQGRDDRAGRPSFLRNFLHLWPVMPAAASCLGVIAASVMARVVLDPAGNFTRTT
jgi:hypothetical protein